MYGFKPARRYFLSFNGVLYDSKAICGAAHRHVADGSPALSAAEFSGGAKTVLAKLRELGFEVVDERPKMAIGGDDGSMLKATCEVMHDQGRGS